MSKKQSREKSVEKQSYLLELEGELTILHLRQPSSHKTHCGVSQLVINCDNGDFNDYSSVVITLTPDQVRDILKTINYKDLDFRKKHVK